MRLFLYSTCCRCSKLKIRMTENTNLPEDMGSFWDSSFKAHTTMWGFTPTTTALMARDLFLAEGIKTILIPGIGYGRNAQAFTAAGISVTGIEISPTAIDIAKQHYGDSMRIFQGSVTDMPFEDHLYEGIFCYGLLYLLNPAQRDKMVQDCYNQLKPGGWMSFAVISKSSPNYGKGRQIAPDTFEIGKGGQLFFYDETAAREAFAAYGLTEVQEVEEPNHAAPHTAPFRFWLIKCRKPA